MNSPRDAAWAPDPKILAAFLDGEFEGRDDLHSLRRRLEVWLATHPGAAADLAEYRRLRQLWHATVPAEPAPEEWKRLLAALEKPQITANSPTESDATFIVHSSSFRRWRPFAYLAGAAAVFLAAVLMDQRNVSSRDVEPFPVAAAHEVEIQHVEGKDTASLVVGKLPLEGNLELAGPGDVSLTSVTPATTDNMVPVIHLEGPGPPIIWAKSGAEEE